MEPLARNEADAIGRTKELWPGIIPFKLGTGQRHASEYEKSTRQPRLLAVNCTTTTDMIPIITTHDVKFSREISSTVLCCLLVPK